MKKIVHVLLYGLLLAVVLTGIMGITHFIRKEDQRVEQEAERLLAAKKAAAENEADNSKTMQSENIRTVLVKKLPVYKEKKIVKIKADNNVEMLSYGDEVTLLEDDSLYAKIETKSGQKGYVWGDCIGMQAESAQTGQQFQAVVIDVEVLQEEQDESEYTAQETICVNIARNLEKRLKERGYTVVMGKRAIEDAVSNAKIAELANQIQADAVVRVCTEYNTDPEVHGAAAYCCPRDSSYPAGAFADDSQKLGKKILRYYTKTTGFTSAGVLESDAFAGIRRSKIPVIVLNMGYLSNDRENSKMSGQKFQAKMAKGIADGLDAYFLWKQKEQAASS